ncbi:pyrokinin-1 receptor, partial [Agrilus planipennis]|uniref:Pyrokinin-1 receptor n=1 Tax=Agrilus planipennis TaxID=224129 RepID=A0A1W4XQF1_AGRPL
MESNFTNNISTLVIPTNDPFVHLTNRINTSDWDSKRDPLLVVIPITLIYSVIFFSGVIGNIGTCIVIANNKSMHTATNYYLFSLAVSDLLLLVSGLPQEMYSIWSRHPYIFGEAFCLLQGFAAETSANATVLTITAFTVERYVAICHPFLSQTLSKLSRAVKFIILIWIFAICLAVPQALAFGIMTYDEDHKYCQITRVILPHSFEISTFVFFITPMTVITILYIRIGLQLRKSTKIIAKSRSIRMKRISCQTRVSLKRKKNQAIVCVDGRENDNNAAGPFDKRENNCIHSTQATKHVVKML